MVGDAFASITPGAFVAVAAALFVTYVLRALRVCDEFRDDVNGRFGATLRIILIHNAMINIVPFRGGETAFPILLRQVFGVSIVRAGATEEEIQEAVAMAALPRHWSTIFNGMQVDFDQFKKEMGGE